MHVGDVGAQCVCFTLRCRFDQLRDLIPHKDKLDKAAFLQKTIDYICQLQVLHDLLVFGLPGCRIPSALTTQTTKRD